MTFGKHTTGHRAFHKNDVESIARDCDVHAAWRSCGERGWLWFITDRSGAPLFSGITNETVYWLLGYRRGLEAARKENSYAGRQATQLQRTD